MILNHILKRIGFNERRVSAAMHSILDKKISYSKYDILVALRHIGEQQWVTGFHCVCSVVGWLIVYQFGILSLSCSQYSQTICLSG